MVKNNFRHVVWRLCYNSVLTTSRYVFLLSSTTSQNDVSWARYFDKFVSESGLLLQYLSCLPTIKLNCNFRHAIRIFCFELNFEFKSLSCAWVSPSVFRCWVKLANSYPGKGTEKRFEVNVSEIGWKPSEVIGYRKGINKVKLKPRCSPNVELHLWLTYRGWVSAIDFDH